jgi:hypothetical protein
MMTDEVSRKGIHYYPCVKLRPGGHLHATLKQYIRRRVAHQSAELEGRQVSELMAAWCWAAISSALTGDCTLYMRG